MIRQWYHVKLLRRAGRGLLGGAAATGEGELALRCPACPHPGRNLPADWETQPLNKRYSMFFVCFLIAGISLLTFCRWIYTLFLMMDANFRLRNKAQRNSVQDGPLGPGFAYFVQPGPFQDYIAKCTHSDEVCI